MRSDYVVKRNAKPKRIEKKPDIQDVEKEPETLAAPVYQPGSIPPHYATRAFRCILGNVLVSFEQFQVINDQLKLYQLLQVGGQPIEVLEGQMVKCPNPKCGHIFVGKEHAVSG